LPLAPFTADRYYDSYWETRLESEPEITTTAPARARIVAGYCEPGASLLDLGCGDGSFLACLRELMPGLDLHGADVSTAALAEARRRRLDVFELDLSDPEARIPGAYDIVTALEVVEHLADAESAVLRAAAAARRYLIVSVPNLGFVEHRLRLLLGRGPLPNVVHDVREHLRHWTVRDFREWSGLLGLEIVAEHPTRPVGAIGLGRRWPSLWSSGMLYVLKPPA
jgi:2-polyprenyl-3-methyl-5-hydroxy-6-metoxy-1,4-benzoquinol methylase